MVADLLRTRQQDGHEPPLVQVTPQESLERELKVLTSRQSFVSVTRASDRVLGVASWTPLAWDSEQLGMPAARVDLLVSSGGYLEALERKSALLRTITDECRMRGIRYLTARVPASDLSGINALGRGGFELVDGILTFSKRVEDAAPPPASNGFEVRPFESRDLEQLLSIARSAYTCDRFHADRTLAPGVADRLYSAWVARSCRGEEADAVIVAAKHGRVMGYVTCKLSFDSGSGAAPRVGTVVLVATADHARGQGVGSATLRGAMDWFRQQGVETVEVGTQMQNVAACRLYENNGFRMTRMSLTFRRLL